jgi:hypothetical protein
VARPPKPDDDGGDFSIQLNPFPKVTSPTQELDTSDLANMAQSGEASAKPNLMIQLEGGQVLELQPGWSQERDPTSSVVVEETPSVIVAGPAPAAARQAPARVVLPPPPAPAPVAAQRSSVWPVVIVYIIAAAALGLAIYERYLS